MRRQIERDDLAHFMVFRKFLEGLRTTTRITVIIDLRKGVRTGSNICLSVLPKGRERGGSFLFDDDGSCRGYAARLVGHLSHLYHLPWFDLPHNIFQGLSILITICYAVLRLSPCAECSLYSSGNFPGVWSLKADVSGLNVGPIVLGDQEWKTGWT